MDMTSFIIGYEAGKNSVEKGPETEETTVTLNLSAGDQVVTPSGEDKAFSQVTIRKPETLIPGNIAQGVDIAGVLGTLTGGSGGTLVAKQGEFIAGGTSHTISHGLGTVPLFVLVRTSGGYLTSQLTDGCIFVATGVSSKVTDALGTTTDCQYGYYYNSFVKNQAQATPDNPIEDSTGLIYNATDTTVTVGGKSGYYLVSGVYYTWWAVGLRES